MDNIRQKAEQDLKQTMEWINSKDNGDWIYNMFIKGPPEGKGFMWCDKEGGENKWWTEKESQGLKDVTQYVLDLGWDSSGYGLFMRKIQKHIKDFSDNPETINFNKKIQKEFSTFKGNSPYTPSNLNVEKSKDFAKVYKKSGFYDMMDDDNKKIMNVWEKEGSDKAVKQMMENAGGDYARMRSMYG